MDYTECKKELQKTISDAVIKFQDKSNVKIHRLDVKINNRVFISSLGARADLGTEVETALIIEL